jgi:NAD(P)-dependent dehydrogenase (short-subunit alcohol dehydrogenase family)
MTDFHPLPADRPLPTEQGTDAGEQNRASRASDTPAPRREAEPAPLHGLTAIVTGGSRGIGLAIARRLASDDASVGLIGRNAAALEDAAAAIGARHAVADVTDRDALRAALDALGPYDIMVNNAGGALSKPFLKHRPRDFQAMLGVNFLAAVTACQHVLPGMRERRFGRIVTIASTAGLKGYAYSAAYVAAKHAAIGFTRALALETVKEGITVNAVCPASPTPTLWAAPSPPSPPVPAGRRKKRGSCCRAAIRPDVWCGLRK